MAWTGLPERTRPVPGGNSERSENGGATGSRERGTAPPAASGDCAAPEQVPTEGGGAEGAWGRSVGSALGQEDRKSGRAWRRKPLGSETVALLPRRERGLGSGPGGLVTGTAWDVDEGPAEGQLLPSLGDSPAVQRVVIESPLRVPRSVLEASGL